SSFLCTATATTRIYTLPTRRSSDLENRTRFATEIIQGIRATSPNLKIGVRLSAFDHPPFKPDPKRGRSGQLGPGIPEEFQKHIRSEEHTSELQSLTNLVCRLLLEKK